MNRIFEPEIDFNSLEVFIVIFVLRLFRHIVFEFTVHTCMPNALIFSKFGTQRKICPTAELC
ncbi:hypothetical protein D4A39_13950 [Alcanivorax profundi]|uniref:Uncharacterized protein n=1 Tax=Alcanivorax profundi TaxID=2338368 RepID=A0A418XUN2_9GAMM|nr:hypothetical protein D4A39_13950 [Alcanivorax profundi]